MPELADYAARIETLAHDLGLTHHGVDFELVPDRFMMETAVYGLPVRMPHWSFGVRYIRELVQRNMGHSRIFEVMFPGEPCKAYLVDANSLAENVLVVAHVLGHADFAHRNVLFRRSLAMAGGRILEQAAARAHRIEAAITKHGQARVEAVLDAALGLEAHIDTNRALYRTSYGDDGGAAEIEPDHDPFRIRWRTLPGEEAPVPDDTKKSRKTPPQPEYDLLWFIAQYGHELEDWERDVFLAVRDESFYFYPVFACQIMNEGWASYWHARLLRETDSLPQDLYLSAIKAHSDVVRPHAAEQQASLATNPYHLGFSIWESIVKEHGLTRAFQIRAEDDDFSFIRNHLTEDLAEELKLFRYERSADGGVKVLDHDIHALRETVLAPKYNFGAPAVLAKHIANDGSLTLVHEHDTDGRGLDLDRAERVLDYLHKVWRRPIKLETIDSAGQPRTVSRAA